MKTVVGVDVGLVHLPFAKLRLVESQAAQWRFCVINEPELIQFNVQRGSLRETLAELTGRLGAMFDDQWFDDVDAVIIEDQPRSLNQRMTAISFYIRGALDALKRARRLQFELVFVPSSRKFSIFRDYYGVVFRNLTYAVTKRNWVKVCERVLASQGDAVVSVYNDFVSRLPKRDDVCDAIGLAIVWFLYTEIGAPTEPPEQQDIDGTPLSELRVAELDSESTVAREASTSRFAAKRTRKRTQRSK